MKRSDLIARITAASSPKPVSVDVEGLGVVLVRVMTAFDADSVRKKIEALPKDDGCQIGRMLALVLCDEGGQPLFNAEDAEQVLMLSKLPQGASTAILKAANEAQSPGKS